MLIRKISGYALAKVGVWAVLAIMALGSTADADLVITEVMSNSGHPGGPSNGDWWELHNSGAATVDLTGYYWDDDETGTDDASIFPSVSIAAGGTLVIVDENATNLAGFLEAWGGGFTAISKDDFGGLDSFSGLSSGGDAIYLFDGDPAASGTLVTSVSFGDSDGGGKSFEWLADGTPAGFSVAGELGAFVAPGPGGGDVGSPGIFAVPEPSGLALLALAGVAGLARRKRS